MPSRSFDDLDSRFKPYAEALVQEIEVHFPVTVICTLRSLAEQMAALKAGTSWTRHSLHLPQPPEKKALAIDLCPRDLLIVKGWGPTDPKWWMISTIAVRMGMRSGMDWHDVGLPDVGQIRPAWDPGHCEYVSPLTLPPARLDIGQP